MYRVTLVLMVCCLLVAFLLVALDLRTQAGRITALEQRLNKTVEIQEAQVEAVDLLEDWKTESIGD